MTISIQRGQQFRGAGATPDALFDKDGNLGPLLRNIAAKLSNQAFTVRLVDRNGGELKLANIDDWNRFFDRHMSDLATASKLKDTFGVSLIGLHNILDDAAMSADQGLTLNLDPNGPLVTGLGLDSERDQYALKLAKDAVIDLEGPVAGKAQAAGVVAIGPWILDVPIAADWQRDRQEQEGWGDFKNTRGANKIFKENTGAAPYTKLTEPNWKDAESMAIVDRFHMPLHLELGPAGPNGEKVFQDHNEMFREVYLTDVDGVLDALEASLRVRVRFDKKDKPAGAPPDAPDEFEIRRVLGQAKEGREVDPVTGASIVHKFEIRWDGNVTEEQAMQAILSGKHNGQIVAMIQKLYKLAKDRGLLPPDGLLKLKPKAIVLQKRRRTHLQLDSINTVKARLEKAKLELNPPAPPPAPPAAPGAPAPPPAPPPVAPGPPDPALERFVQKLEAQLAEMTAAETLLKKYGQWMPSGECVIVSADRYNVYDPGARATMPTDIDDAQGRVGVGPLHVEAEWDTAGSDPFEKALKAIEEKLKANPAPANPDELKADAEAIEKIRQVFRDDVNTAKDILNKRLEDAGLEPVPEKRSKEEWSDVIMAKRKDAPYYWLG